MTRCSRTNDEALQKRGTSGQPRGQRANLLAVSDTHCGVGNNYLLHFADFHPQRRFVPMSIDSVINTFRKKGHWCRKRFAVTYLNTMLCGVCSRSMAINQQLSKRPDEALVPPLPTERCCLLHRTCQVFDCASAFDMVTTPRLFLRPMFGCHSAQFGAAFVGDEI